MHLETIKNYRTDQIKNYLTTHESYKLKITNSNSQTKWMTITAEELAQIASILNKEGEA
jgi:hypothetical protein